MPSGKARNAFLYPSGGGSCKLRGTISLCRGAHMSRATVKSSAGESVRLTSSVKSPAGECIGLTASRCGYGDRCCCECVISFHNCLPFCGALSACGVYGIKGIGSAFPYPVALLYHRPF